MVSRPCSFNNYFFKFAAFLASPAREADVSEIGLNGVSYEAFTYYTVMQAHGTPVW